MCPRCGFSSELYVRGTRPTVTAALRTLVGQSRLHLVDTQASLAVVDTSILDPHVHLWNPRDNPRPTRGLVRLLGFSPRLLNLAARALFPKATLDFFGTPEHATKPYLPANYDADCSAHRVRGVVHVEAGWEENGPLGPVGETRWLEGLGAVGAGRIEAIVAHANLDLGKGVGEVLRAHKEASDRVRGVRDMLAWHPNAGVHNFASRAGRMADPRFREGFEQLAEHGLSFDAWCYHHQLPELITLARAYPDQPIVLCHLGTPVALGGPFAGLGSGRAERERIRGEWEASMAALSECGNVSVKLSGLAMPVCGYGFDPRQPPSLHQVVDLFGPPIRFAITHFGPSRAMFASNFPVDKATLSWTLLFAAYRAMGAEFSEAEQQQLFCDSAALFYGLDSAQASARAAPVKVSASL